MDPEPLLEPRLNWWDKLKAYNLTSRRSKTMFVCRIVVMICAVAFSIMNASTGMALPVEGAPCLLDNLHTWTAGANAFLASHHSLCTVLLILTSLCSDCLLLKASYHYFFWGQTWRLFIAVASLFALRTLCVTVFAMEEPENSLWFYPGLPSLLIPYGTSQGFFFSGYIGILTLLTLDCWHRGETVVFCLAFVLLVIQSILAIVLRSHYCIDVIFAFIFGHYLWIVSEKPAQWLYEKLAEVTDEQMCS